MTTGTVNDPLKDLAEIKTESLPFEKIGDWIRGTLTERKKMPSKYNPGRLDNVYEFKAAGGWVHDKAGKEINLIEGNFYSFWGKPQMDGALRNVQIGQIFGMQFKENKPTTKGNPQKIFRVALGKMDEAYMGETAGTTEVISVE